MSNTIESLVEDLYSQIMQVLMSDLDDHTDIDDDELITQCETILNMVLK